MSNVITKTCGTCRNDFEWADIGGGIGKTWFCKACYPKASKKKSERMANALKHEDRLKYFWDQCRTARAELDDIKSKKDQISAETMAKAVAVVYERVRKMRFWDRVKLLFNPFG